MQMWSPGKLSALPVGTVLVPKGGKHFLVYVGGEWFTRYGRDSQPGGFNTREIIGAYAAHRLTDAQLLRAILQYPAVLTRSGVTASMGYTATVTFPPGMGDRMLAAAVAMDKADETALVRPLRRALPKGAKVGTPTLEAGDGFLRAVFPAAGSQNRRNPDDVKWNRLPKLPDHARRADIRDYYIKHCGVPEKEVNKLIGKGASVATTRTSLTPEQLARFEAAARQETNPVTRAILLLLPRTGLRITEITTLRADNVDLRDGEPRSLTFRGKGDKERTVPLTKRCRAILREYLGWVRGSYRVKRDGDLPWLFPSMGQAHAQAATIRTAMRRVCEKAKIPVITPHTLRHTYISIQVSLCADPRYIQRVAGHASKTMTFGYTHPSAWGEG